MGNFHALTVQAVDRLTPNSVSLTFDIPDTLKTEFSYKAGQYITIKKVLGGEELRRSYSISCAPNTEKLSVGIKKVSGGSFSIYANEEIKEGDLLEVMPPEGRFVFEPNGAAKNVAAFAAGSGITPIMSIVETVLSSHTESSFVLVFGNQSPNEVMYANKIKELQTKYTDRFFVQHVFSRTPGNDGLFGRIETSTVNFILKNKFKDTVFDTFYLCGPEAMIDTVSDTLKEGGVDEKKILFELFNSDEVEDTLAENLDGKTKIEVLVDDEVFHFTMNKKDLVLDAVLKENIDAPYSCQGGICSSCVARVVEGRVEMVKNQILTDVEVDEGLVLTCQSHPLTPNLKIDYDDV